jgi:hypothetical protein
MRHRDDVPVVRNVVDDIRVVGGKPPCQYIAGPLSIESVGDSMEFQELLDEIDAVHPNVIGLKVPEKVAAGLLRAAFQVVRKRVRSVEQGEVDIQGLGVFLIKKVERGEGPERVTRRVVNFRLQQPKPPSS